MFIAFIKIDDIKFNSHIESIKELSRNLNTINELKNFQYYKLIFVSLSISFSYLTICLSQIEKKTK